MLRRELHNLQLEHKIQRMQHEIDETSMRLEMLASTPFTDKERVRPKVYSLRDGIKSEKIISDSDVRFFSKSKEASAQDANRWSIQDGHGLSN
ncbi:hypothetical protein DPMN_089650 [Dreissena polymorpha]|uniref:Uncharacterized protein n=1 Tax=Dreissena polymorpha TaxID=45954 RepID=A0A9D4KWU8_DREPO|nr:hypothetical protein DPMN_089650 [Dreissena polymorpha]